MKLAYIDAVGGVAGDMLLAGFLSASAAEPEAFLGSLVSDLGLKTVTYNKKDVRRGGFKSMLVEVKCAGGGGVDWHSLKSIISILENSRLQGGVKKRSISTFRRLAQAEAKAHGKSMDDLHLHETGDADAIIEIAGTLSLVDKLGLESVICSPLPMGRGTIRSSHGPMPLPAPAVAEMLEGIPVRGVDIEGETVTPTGMALLREIAGKFGLMPAMIVENFGAGAGSRDSGKIPNLLRVFIGSSLEEKIEREALEKNVIIETNIDDMAATVFQQVYHKLFEAGALDVYTTPILMKKGRPAQKLSVLCEPNKVDVMLGVIFMETTSSGARFYEVTKRNLPRRNIEVETEWGKIPVKITLMGDETVHAAPEYDACRTIADLHSIPVKKVLEEVASIARKKVKP